MNVDESFLDLGKPKSNRWLLWRVDRALGACLSPYKDFCSLRTCDGTVGPKNPVGWVM